MEATRGREDVMAGLKNPAMGKKSVTAQKGKSVVGTRQGIKKCKGKVKIICVLGSTEKALRKSCNDGTQARVREMQNPLLDKN